MVTAKVALEMLAGFPQTPKSFSRHLRGSRKRQKVLRDTCGVPANAKKFSETLAGFPQTPKSFLRHLRDSRKRQKVLRGTCGVPANTKKFSETLAGLPQTPKSSPRHLRDSRKRQKALRDACGSSASLLVWRKPKEGSGKNDRVLGDKCIGSNGFASTKKRQSVGIDEDGA